LTSWNTSFVWSSRQPVKARAASLTSVSPKLPTPSVKSSMSSRAKFSFGADAWFWPASSHTSMAGSLATACMSVSNEPAPLVRNSAFWRSMRSGQITFSTLVAKCPCQNHGSFSCSGRLAATIRASHHDISCTRSLRSWLRSTASLLGSALNAVIIGDFITPEMASSCVPRSSRWSTAAS
jgi:hypothetical protein